MRMAIPKAKKDEIKALFPGEGHLKFKRDGSVVVMDGYFYRCGRTLEKLAATVKERVPDAIIVEQSDHWNPWPKRTWMQVTFRLPE